MRPRLEPKQPQRELFQIDLEQLIDIGHPLVRLGVCLDWPSLEQTLGRTCHPSQGAPGISTRRMAALHYLKYQLDLSDEDVVAAWVENPYWMHFSGMRHFQHRMPMDPSSMTRWRKRLGEAGAAQRLRATLEAGMKMRVIRPAEWKRIHVDTTVQTRAIRFPTDARLYQRMRERLVKVARAEGFTLKQSYEHVGRRLLMQSSRYAHARPMKRARACTRKLKTQLGRVTREIERQAWVIAATTLTARSPCMSISGEEAERRQRYGKLLGAFCRIFLCRLLLIWNRLHSLQDPQTRQIQYQYA